MRTVVLLPVLGFAALQALGFIGYAVAIVHACARDRSLPLGPAMVVATAACSFGIASAYAVRKLIGGLRGAPLRPLRIAAALAFGPVTVAMLTVLDAMTVRTLGP